MSHTINIWIVKRSSYDAGKEIKGHKRHLLVDTQGLVLKAKIHSADIARFLKCALSSL